MHASPAGSQQSPHGAKPPSHIILGSLGYSGRFELAVSSPYLSLEAFPTPTHYNFSSLSSFLLFCFFMCFFFVKIISLQVCQSFFEDSQRHKGTPSVVCFWVFQGGGWAQDLCVPVRGPPSPPQSGEGWCSPVSGQALAVAQLSDPEHITCGV